MTKLYNPDPIQGEAAQLETDRLLNNGRNDDLGSQRGPPARGLCPGALMSKSKVVERGGSGDKRIAEKLNCAPGCVGGNMFSGAVLKTAALLPLPCRLDWRLMTASNALTFVRIGSPFVLQQTTSGCERSFPRTEIAQARGISLQDA
jgi:hypothetical protein